MSGRKNERRRLKHNQVNRSGGPSAQDWLTKNKIVYKKAISLRPRLKSWSQ